MKTVWKNYPAWKPVHVSYTCAHLGERKVAPSFSHLWLKLYPTKLTGYVYLSSRSLSPSHSKVTFWSMIAARLFRNGCAKWVLRFPSGGKINNVFASKLLESVCNFDALNLGYAWRKRPEGRQEQRPSNFASNFRRGPIRQKKKRHPPMMRIFYSARVRVGGKFYGAGGGQIIST